jgi:hypothetical protein
MAETDGRRFIENEANFPARQMAGTTPDRIVQNKANSLVWFSAIQVAMARVWTMSSWGGRPRSPEEDVVRGRTTYEEAPRGVAANGIPVACGMGWCILCSQGRMECYGDQD